MKILSILVKNSLKTETKLFLVRYFTWKLELVSDILWMVAGTKFQLKLTILIFRTIFAQKGYFQSKTEKVNTTMEKWKKWTWSQMEKVNITIEFWIYELVLVPNVSLN